MPHDIIDNRDERLIDHIRRILPGSRSAKFAVGYFCLSGLEAVADQLRNVEELRLLIGNTSSRRSLGREPRPLSGLVQLVTVSAGRMGYAPNLTGQSRWAQEGADGAGMTSEGWLVPIHQEGIDGNREGSSPAGR